MNCSYCGKPVILIPSAAERAAKFGGKPSDYTRLEGAGMVFTGETVPLEDAQRIADAKKDRELYERQAFGF